MPNLYRVILPVTDIDAAEAFYAQILEMPGERVSPERHYFDCDQTILACLDVYADRASDTPEFRPNPECIYIAVDDLDAAYARCQAADAALDRTRHHHSGTDLGKIEVRPWGERSFYFHDPFGNPMCFVDPGTLFTGL